MKLKELVHLQPTVYGHYFNQVGNIVVVRNALCLQERITFDPVGLLISAF